MEKSNNFEAMKMELLKEIENNIQQNNLQESILGMMELAGFDTRVGLLIDKYSTGELIKLDLLKNNDDIDQESEIETMEEIQDEKFYKVKDNIGGKYIIWEVSKIGIELCFKELKEAC